LRLWEGDSAAPIEPVPARARNAILPRARRRAAVLLKQSLLALLKEAMP
jgi:hypothetical protein